MEPVSEESEAVEQVDVTPENVRSQTEDLYSQSVDEQQGSKSQLLKMLQFAPDVAGPENSAIRFSVPDDDHVVAGEEFSSNWIFDQEEEGEEEEALDENLGNNQEEEELKGETKEEEVEQEEEEYEEEEEEEEEEEDTSLQEEQHLIGYGLPTVKEIKVKSNSDLSKIPSQIYNDRNAMLLMLRDLSNERPDLTLKNRYLEYKTFRHLRLIQVTGSPPIDDGSTLEDDTERDRYMKFLSHYKKESEKSHSRENEIKESLDILREKLRERLSNDSDNFGKLTAREVAIAVDLVFAKTGRKLTQKRVEEMIRRQTSRRKQVARERFRFIRQWYNFEEIDEKIRRLETLGPGMKISDYEAEFAANLTAKTKIDKRNRELQTARSRVCGIMAAISHGKVKLSYLNNEIERRKSFYGQMIESVKKRREELSTMRGKLSSTRNTYLKKRENAGLMLALPTLREMERVSELRNFWKEEVSRLRILINRSRPESVRKFKRSISSESGRVQSSEFQI